MVTINLKGYVTEDGQLKADLPENHPVGEVNLIIEPVDEEAPWTDEEIAEMLHPEPMTGAEIAQHPSIGSWADKGIEDSVKWVKEQRRKRRERFKGE